MIGIALPGAGRMARVHAEGLAGEGESSSRFSSKTIGR